MAALGSLPRIDWYHNALVFEVLAAFKQGSGKLSFLLTDPLKLSCAGERLQLPEKLVASEYQGSTATSADLVGAELG